MALKKKMLTIRRASPEDVIAMQECNQACLAENYKSNFFVYHLVSWPQCCFVCAVGKKIVGYVLGKIEENEGDLHGHINSIAVLRPYRKLGIATRLLRHAHTGMSETFGAKYATLHVREGNRAALSVYHDVLRYEIVETCPKYYADGENAFFMKCKF